MLFKARLRRTKDERDLALTWPMLAEDNQTWLRKMLRRVDKIHPWLERLT